MALADWISLDLWQKLTVAFRCDALFNTYCFILLFFPAVLLVYWLIPPGKARLAFLTLASFLFYGFWDARFIPLLLASTLVDYWVAQRIAAAPTREASKRWLVTSIAFNLGMLGIFKYLVFFADNARSALAYAGLPAAVPEFSIVLPIGISFYTFQTLSYTIDVYRGHVPPTRNLVKYAAYVTMFPQLVAGPIVRYRTMDQQLDDLPRRPRLEGMTLGLTLFVIGLFKKIVVADTIARFIDPVWADPSGVGTLVAWLIAIGYALQLYFDFSGYSDMAIGLGAMLGFRFPVNFMAPYQAVNPSDIWRRWHISLTTFIRDYLFIPLGGSKVSAARHRINILVVMFVVGLWHGADWNQVVWGVFQGGVLILYREVSPWWDARHVALQRAMTLGLWVLSLTIFRANTIPEAFDLLRVMIVPTGLNFAILLQPIVLAIGVLVVLVLKMKPTMEMNLRPTPLRAAGLATMFMICLALIGAVRSPFLYYQF